MIETKLLAHTLLIISYGAIFIVGFAVMAAAGAWYLTQTIRNFRSLFGKAS